MKPPLHADGMHMCIWMENTKASAKKLLELITKFSKVAGCKIHIQKSVTFLSTHNETLEKEREGTIPFKMAPPKCKHLGIHLTKGAEDLYAESYKTFIKKGKKMERKEKIVHAPGLEKLML